MRRELSMLFIVLFAVIISVCNAQTPEWLWAARAGGAGWDTARAVAVDQDDFIYISGGFSDTAMFGSTSLNSGSYNRRAGFLAKITPNGYWLWARAISSSRWAYSTGISLDNAGNIFVTGVFRQDITIGTTTFTGTNAYSDFVAKLDGNGDCVWIRSVAGTVNGGQPSIAHDGFGNNYLAGQFNHSCGIGDITLSTPGDSTEIYIAKIDGEGDWLWAHRSGGIWSDQCNDVHADAAGNCYITGSFQNVASFGATELVCQGGSDTFVAKLDGSGNWLWVREAGGLANDWGTAVATDDAGGCYAVGSFYSDASFGDISIVSDTWYENFFVAKLDTGGNWLWARSGTGANLGVSLSDIHAAANGICTMSGRFFGVMYINDIILDDMGWTWDLLLLQIDSEGNWLSALSVSDEESDSLIYGLAVDSSNHAIVTGEYFGPLSFGAYALPDNNSSYDIFVAKLEPASSPTEDQTNPVDFPRPMLSEVSPNPFRRSSIAQIKAYLPPGEAGSVSIYNLRGEVIWNRQLISGDHELSIDLSDHPSGVYLCRLKAPSGTAVRKFVLLR